MSESDYEAFLSGDRPDDVAVFVSDAFLASTDALVDHGVRVDPRPDDETYGSRPGGVVLVVEGDRGRRVFRKLTGMDAMGFAQRAMGTEGDVAPDLAGGNCPEGGGPGHTTEFVFAFAEERNDEVGGVYAEGDVVHAYAYCACGTAYGDRWVAGERERE